MRALLASFVLLASGCLTRFPSTDAYAGQSYVCGEPGAITARAQACAPLGCGGSMSFTGVLDGNALSVTSDLSSTAFVLNSVNGQEVLDDVIGSGTSPYFDFSFDIASIGGAFEGLSGRTLTFDAQATTLPGELTDDRVDPLLTLIAGGESSALDGITDRGTVTLRANGDRDVAGTLSGDLGQAGDHLDVCFDVLALEERLTVDGT